jgi:hypothetical protein
MKTNFAPTVILLCLLTIASTQSAFAQTATVGVNPGNTFNYSYMLTWDSTDPTATVPTAYEELNNTQLIRITIITVAGSLINVDFTRHFNNGTENTQNGNIDVNSQLLEIPYSVLIIRAGANSGEKIYPAGGHATLSDVATRTYSIGRIETIRYVSPEAAGSNFEKTEIFFDRANGVGVEYNFESQETSGLYTTTTKETLMITSWVIPEFPSTAVLTLLLIAIPIVLITFKKKGQSNRKFTMTLKE